MIIAAGNILNLASAGHDWVVTFDVGDETGEVVCPVIGWATVVVTVLNDGTARTEVEPAFLWGGQVWTETELRAHADVVKGYGIHAREITGLLAVADGPTR